MSNTYQELYRIILLILYFFPAAKNRNTFSSAGVDEAFFKLSVLFPNKLSGLRFNSNGQTPFSERLNEIFVTLCGYNNFLVLGSDHLYYIYPDKILLDAVMEFFPVKSRHATTNLAKKMAHQIAL